MVRIGVGDLVGKRYGKPHSFRVKEGAVGSHVQRGEELGRLYLEAGTVEVLAPIGGNLVATNNQLEDEPDLVASDPYNRGWIAYVRTPSSAEEAVGILLSPKDYMEWLQGEACHEE